MEPKNLKGTVPKGKIDAVDGDGNVIDPSKAIFPILKENNHGNFYLVGTGFFITDSGIFVTAKHVLLDVIDKKGVQTHPIFLMQFLGDGYIKRPILRCTSHEVADITVGISAPMNHNLSGLPFKNKVLELTPSIPAVGQSVFTYAYPNNEIKHGETQEIYLYPDYFDGSIQEIYPNGRDLVMLPGACVQTSMYIHGGASGGPVFDSLGKVFGVNSTGYDNDDLSFITPIHTIENLLIDDISIPSNSTGKVLVKELIDNSFISYEYLS
jgi:hypothetical protein